ncbi:MAG TPA: hypothetical protein DCY35_11380 [Prolixibacteraceae bacterium]|nr:hypothetical protein [Prolixibacteraceae bacterium]
MIKTLIEKMDRIMKNKKTDNINLSAENQVQKDNMTRKEALKKAGYYTATAAGMMILLGSPKKSIAASPAPPPPW